MDELCSVFYPFVAVSILRELRAQLILSLFCRNLVRVAGP